MGLKTQLSKWQKCRHSYAVYRMLWGHDVPNGYSLCSFEKQMKRSHQANTRIYGGHIYIHIYTYICILNYIKYIYALWLDGIAQPTYSYIYIGFICGPSIHGQKKASQMGHYNHNNQYILYNVICDVLNTSSFNA